MNTTRCYPWVSPTLEVVHFGTIMICELITPGPRGCSSQMGPLNAVPVAAANCQQRCYRVIHMKPCGSSWLAMRLPKAIVASPLCTYMGHLSLRVCLMSDATCVLNHWPDL